MRPELVKLVAVAKTIADCRRAWMPCGEENLKCSLGSPDETRFFDEERLSGEMHMEVFLSQTALLKRGLLLEYLTLGWNIVGVVLVILAALAARSVALAGFGLDSLIEIFASVVVVWQLTGVNQHRERLALRLIGIAFIALVLYIVAQLFVTLLAGTHAATSIGGIIWIAATFLAMLLLAFGKRTTGQQLKNEVLLTEGRVTMVNEVLLTEGRVTMVDAYLAGAVLVGLLLNALFGWWWADPLASLVIIYYGIREALHALRESTESVELLGVDGKDR